MGGGEGRRMGGEGGGETKDGKEKIKKEDDNKQNRTKPKKKSNPKEVGVKSKGEMGGRAGRGGGGGLAKKALSIRGCACTQ